MQSYNDPILQRVYDFIVGHNLLPDPSLCSATIIVGLSGGADSVVLTHILYSLGYNLLATHCHFGLRGSESDRDFHFSRGFAAQLGIDFQEVHFDTLAYQSSHKLSTEMACRELRYQWWNEKFLAPHPDWRLAVGHHQDDNIETMLMNLMRGTGLQGLLGIPVQNGTIIRPLLCLSKADILTYAKEHSLDFITDSSNLSNDYTRNKIRNLLLPLMTSIYPQTRTGIAETIEHLHDTLLFTQRGIADLVLSHSSTNQDNGIVYHTLSYAALSGGANNRKTDKAVLYAFFKHHNCTFSAPLFQQIAQCVTERKSNKMFMDDSTICYVLDNGISISTDTRLWNKEIRNNDNITIGINDAGAYQITPSTPVLPMQSQAMPTSAIRNRKIVVNEISVDDFKQCIRQAPADKQVVFLDLDTLCFPLQLRRWKQGDRIQPMGMLGMKKVSDLFSNQHFSALDKALSWVLVDAHDTILWVSGCRANETGKVTTHTQRVLCIKNQELA